MPTLVGLVVSPFTPYVFLTMRLAMAYAPTDSNMLASDLVLVVLVLHDPNIEILAASLA